MNRSPELTGRRVRLEAFARQHLSSVYAIAVSPALAGRWPLRGRSIPPAAFGEILYANSPVLFAIVRLDTEEVVGLALGYDIDHRSATGFASFMLGDSVWRAGWPIEALLLMIDFMFEAVGLRKIYFRIPEYNLDKFRGVVGRWLKFEGVLRDHWYTHGTYRDVHTFAIESALWDRELIGRIVGRDTRAV